MISVICPTIDGREEHFERCEKAYAENTATAYEFIVIRNEPTCGIAWQKGAEQAKGDYIHFTADDLEPWTNWDKEAREMADDGWLPAPIIWNAPNQQIEAIGPTLYDGFFTRIPFCTAAQWDDIGPMIPLHYYTDNWFSARGKEAGYESIEVEGYRFSHWWAMSGRLMDNMQKDFELYKHYREAGYEL